jgi:hypothetical protein
VIRDVKDRVFVFPELHLKLASASDFSGVVQRLAPSGAGERGFHFLSGLEEELIVGKAQSLRIVDRFACLDAQQDVVGFRILFAEVVAIIGRNEGNGQFLAEISERLVHHDLLGKHVGLDLEIKPVVEHGGELSYLVFGLLCAV